MIYIFIFFLLISLFFIFRFLKFLKLNKSIYIFYIFLFQLIFSLSFYLCLGNIKFLNFNYIFIKNKEEKELARRIIFNFNKQISLIKQCLISNNSYILWWHLGKLYEIQGIYEKSLEYIKIAYYLNPNNFDLMINYVVLNSKNSNGFLNLDILDIVDKILKINPLQLDIINLLAIDAYNKGNYNIAKKNWQIFIDNYNVENNINKKFLNIIRKKIDEIE